MKKFLALSLGILLTGMLTAQVNAEQDETSVFPSQESQFQSDQGQTPAPEQQEATDQGNPNDAAEAPNEENPVQNDQGQTQEPLQQGTSSQGTPNDAVVAPNEENPVQNDQGQKQEPRQQRTQGTVGQVTPNDPSMSMDARYKQRLENKKRAAEMRQKLMSESEGQEQTSQPTAQ